MRSMPCSLPGGAKTKDKAPDLATNPASRQKDSVRQHSAPGRGGPSCATGRAGVSSICCASRGRCAPGNSSRGWGRGSKPPPLLPGAEHEERQGGYSRRLDIHRDEEKTDGVRGDEQREGSEPAQTEGDYQAGPRYRGGRLCVDVQEG